MKGRDLLLALGATATGGILIALSSPESIEAPRRALSADAPATREGAPPEPDRRSTPPAISGRFGDWRYIVVHHTGEVSGDVATLDARHRAEMGFEDGLAFHLLVGNGNGLALGAVAESDRWKRGIPGPHCTENPSVSLASVGVAAIGDTAAAPLPPEQLETLSSLVEELRRKLALPRERVLLHREVEGGDPRCPGPLFDAVAFRAAMGGSPIESPPAAGAERERREEEEFRR